MQWKHVDLLAKRWLVPDTKASRPLVVPLSDAAVAILKKIKAMGLHSELVFPSSIIPDCGMGKNQMLQLLQSHHPGLAVHGFRASFRKWASNQVNDRGVRDYSSDVVESVLAHEVKGGNKVQMAYDDPIQLKMRRGVLAAWSEFVTTPPAKVIPMIAA